MRGHTSQFLHVHKKRDEMFVEMAAEHRKKHRPDSPIPITIEIAPIKRANRLHDPTLIFIIIINIIIMLAFRQYSVVAIPI